MKRAAIALSFILAVSPAFAQTATIEQRVGAQVGAILTPIMIQNAQLQAQVEQLQAQIAELQKKLAAKAEPNKD